VSLGVTVCKVAYDSIYYPTSDTKCKDGPYICVESKGRFFNRQLN